MRLDTGLVSGLHGWIRASFGLLTGLAVGVRVGLGWGLKRGQDGVRVCGASVAQGSGADLWSCSVRGESLFLPRGGVGGLRAYAAAAISRQECREVRRAAGGAGRLLGWSRGGPQFHTASLTPWPAPRRGSGDSGEGEGAGPPSTEALDLFTRQPVQSGLRLPCKQGLQGEGRGGGVKSLVSRAVSVFNACAWSVRAALTDRRA